MIATIREDEIEFSVTDGFDDNKVILRITNDAGHYMEVVTDLDELTAVVEGFRVLREVRAHTPQIQKPKKKK